MNTHIFTSDWHRPHASHLPSRSQPKTKLDAKALPVDWSVVSEVHFSQNMVPRLQGMNAHRLANPEAVA
jgi:hypothetical protein